MCGQVKLRFSNQKKLAFVHYGDLVAGVAVALIKVNVMMKLKHCIQIL